jgi:hypothetical protein
MANQNAKATAVIAHEIRIAVTTSLNHSQEDTHALPVGPMPRRNVTGKYRQTPVHLGPNSRVRKPNRAKCQTSQQAAAGLMSVPAQTQKSECATGKSALPSTTGIVSRRNDVCEKDE